MLFSAIATFVVVLVTMIIARKATASKRVQSFFKKEEEVLSDVFSKYSLMAIAGFALLAALGFLIPFAMLLLAPHATWAMALIDATGYLSICSFTAMIAMSASFGPSNDPLMFTGLERECFGHCTCRCHKRPVGIGPL